MKSIASFIIIIFLSAQTYGNNISITNVTLTGQNTSAGVNDPSNYTLVQFSISWENSWRMNVGPSNWDAAWVFVKYRVNGAGDWHHAYLNNTGHTAPSGSVIDAGLIIQSSPFNNTMNPCPGVFIYRNSNGSGTFTLTNVQLRWNYGSQNIPDNFPIEVQVFGLEMVYVPTGEFNVGGGGGINAFTSTTINTSSATTAPIGTGSLGGQEGGYPTGQTAPASAFWPNGYSKFYCMKYEISQQQYVDFLNTLTRTQQGAHVETDITGMAITNRYVMTNSTGILNRNGIRCNAAIPPAPAPASFYCDLNNNGIGAESDDGQWVACNYLSWADLTAYLDWSGLRPMTDLEFEKVCRGTLPAVPGELAWGNTNISGATGVLSPGQSSETANSGNIVYNNDPGLQGPVRVGSFSKASSSREEAGASYYGATEMSGNVYERIVTIGNIDGRSFLFYHGDGSLQNSGDPDVPSWPGISGSGGGFRGSSWQHYFNSPLISARVSAVITQSSRIMNSGGRGVKTAP